MKRIFYLFLATTMLQTSCKKDDLKPPPIPPFVGTNELQLVINSLPGEPATGINNVYAIVTIANNTNEVVIANKKLVLTFSNNKYATEKLQLPVGQYKIIKFLVNNESDITRFAAPFSNSVKAGMVQKPLSINFSIPNNAILNIPVEVLKVEAGDTPENFGYPPFSFDQPISAGNFKIKIRATIKIGDIVYDNIPADYRIRTWLNQSEFFEKDTSLAAGTNEILLSKDAIKYTITLNKWGISKEIHLQNNEVDETITYSLLAVKAPKLLRSTTKYNYTNGDFRIDRKEMYYYDDQGRLKEIKYYYQSPTETTLRHISSEIFSYNGNNLKVYYTDDNGSSEAYHYSAFSFDAQGRVHTSEFKYLMEHHIYQIVYSSQGINIYLLDANNTPTDVQMQLKTSGGNVIERKWITGNSISISKSAFDLNINPYVHMKWYSFHFENTSKNNLIEEGSTNTNGSFEVNSKYQNSYDSEGYLTESIQKSRIIGTNQFREFYKTTFTY